MPTAPPQPCIAQPCPNYAEVRGRCRVHARVANRAMGTTVERGYDSTWKKVRLMVLREEPLCRRCAERGLTVAAEEVDHIYSIRERPDLRLVRANLQPLCSPCHHEVERERRAMEEAR